jgi:hypothetical protein
MNETVKWAERPARADLLRADSGKEELAGKSPVRTTFTHAGIDTSGHEQATENEDRQCSSKQNQSPRFTLQEEKWEGTNTKQRLNFSLKLIKMQSILTITEVTDLSLSFTY